MLSPCGDVTRQSSTKQDEPADYVIATGQPHSVQEFVEAAFGRAGLVWEQHVVTDPAFLRPAEVDHLVDDSSKARVELGWEPKTSVSELVEAMVDAHLERLGNPSVPAAGTSQ
jgi:GDPmannose 4,6-dehydratase